jgi:hypothetical protein
VICFRGVKFPHKAMVLLLESDAACTSLNGHSARKIAELVLVVLSLLFIRSLRILSGCHIINKCVGHQGMKLRGAAVLIPGMAL